MCQNSLPSGGGRSLAAKISGGKGRSWGIFFGFYKTRHILLHDSANYTVLRAVVLTHLPACDGRTDGQSDGIAACNASIAEHCKNDLPNSCIIYKVGLQNADTAIMVKMS